MLIQTITLIRKKRYCTSVSMLLKQVYGKLDDDTKSEVKHLMSCIVTFPISEAIVESWGSTIDSLIQNKVAFKEMHTVDTIDVTEKIDFNKLGGPSAGSSANRKLFKWALILMYGGQDYVKDFMKSFGRGFTSKGGGGSGVL